MSRPARRCIILPLERRCLLTSVAGSVFYDDDLDGAQGPGEVPLSQWMVYLDSNSNNTLDGTTATYNWTGASFAIADKSTYNVPLVVGGASGTIADVDVRINITHNYLADLDLFLTSPSGVKIELCTDNGGAGRDYTNTVFDDDAPQRINGIQTSTNTARYRPEFSMGQWNGSSINGTWTLQVTDDSLGDTGTFINWGLTIRNGEPDATTFTDGRYLLETSASGTLTVKPVIQAGHVAHRASATVNLAAGGAATGVDFGVRLPPAAIGGRVFNDLNADGIQQAGEAGIAARVVFLDLNDNGQLDPGERSIVTNTAGDYLFTAVKPQTYRVRTVIPFGWTQTTPTSANLLGLRAPADALAASPRAYVQDQVLIDTSDWGRFTREIKTRASAELFEAIDFAKTSPLGGEWSILNLRAGYDPAKLASRLDRLTSVRRTALNYIYRDADPREYTPNDPQFPAQTFHARIGSTSAWDLGEGAGVKVAVIDDGVLLSHPDLAPNLWSNPGEIANNGIDDDGNGYIDDKNGWDFTGSTGIGTGDNNPNPGASDSHGTHIAGVIAARTNNALNVAGVAGRATIIPVRFFGSGAWTSTVIYNAFKYAADVGAKIVNVSYNVDAFVEANDPLYRAAIDYLDARGVVHINSAGNENRRDPARAAVESTIYVAAVDASDRKVTDSNFGDGIDLSAPGEPILSTTNSNGSASTGMMGGTSVAAAVASGVAALIWARNQTWTREQVVAQLFAATDAIDAANPEHLGLLGSGRVDAHKALTQTPGAPTLGVVAGLPADGSTIVVAPTSFSVEITSALDPVSANSPANWQLQGAGPDGLFGNSDDAVISLLRSTYQIASNAIRFTIEENLSPGVYRFVAHSGAGALRDPFGRALDGNGDGTGGDDRVITFTLSSRAAAHIVTPAPGATSGGHPFGTRQVNVVGGPRVVDAVLSLDTAQRITLTLDQPVSDIAPSAVSIRNLATNTLLPASTFWTFYDSNARQLLVQVNGNSLLGDGAYRLTLAASGVVNAQGATMGSDYAYDFVINRADFDRSGSVDFNDLLVIAQNYRQPGVFSQGDSNYDGVINFDDLLAVAQRYGAAAQYAPPLRAKRRAATPDSLE